MRFVNILSFVNFYLLLFSTCTSYKITLLKRTQRQQRSQDHQQGHESVVTHPPITTPKTQHLHGPLASPLVWANLTMRKFAWFKFRKVDIFTITLIAFFRSYCFAFIFIYPQLYSKTATTTQLLHTIYFILF